MRRVAGEVSAAHPNGALLVGVLKGSVPFLADLARAMTVPVEIDFLAISSYAASSGRVRLEKDLGADIAGRDVLLVEDIIDTGLTAAYLLGELAGREPASVTTCALLDRRVRRIVPTPVPFVGFEVTDDFLLGYGLDFAGRYRNLPAIWVGDVEALRMDPDAHVARVYAG